MRNSLYGKQRRCYAQFQQCDLTITLQERNIIFHLQDQKTGRIYEANQSNVFFRMMTQRQCESAQQFYQYLSAHLEDKSYVTINQQFNIQIIYQLKNPSKKSQNLPIQIVTKQLPCSKLQLLRRQHNFLLKSLSSLEKKSEENTIKKINKNSIINKIQGLVSNQIKELKNLQEIQEQFKIDHQNLIQRKNRSKTLQEKLSSTVGKLEKQLSEISPENSLKGLTSTTDPYPEKKNDQELNISTNLKLQDCKKITQNLEYSMNLQKKPLISANEFINWTEMTDSIQTFRPKTTKKTLVKEPLQEKKSDQLSILKGTCRSQKGHKSKRSTTKNIQIMKSFEIDKGFISRTYAGNNSCLAFHDFNNQTKKKLTIELLRESKKILIGAMIVQENHPHSPQTKYEEFIQCNNNCWYLNIDEKSFYQYGKKNQEQIIQNQINKNAFLTLIIDTEKIVIQWMVNDQFIYAVVIPRKTLAGCQILPFLELKDPGSKVKIVL